MSTSRVEKLLNNPEALCNMVRRIAIEAGAITLKYFDGIEDMGVEAKSDSSPVTRADREAEIHIQNALADLTPDIPFIGEEAAELGQTQSVTGHQYFWCVDPLDGTKAFINGNEDYTVNIALIKDHVPILGVVFAPALGELYAGFGEGTALKWSEDTGKEKPIGVRPPPNNGLTVITNRTQGQSPKLDEFLQQFKIKKAVKRASSIKICAIANGKADIYPRFGPTCEWDTAAGDAVLRAAGGAITTLNGEPLKYGGHDPKWLNPQFVASSFQWHDSGQ